MILIKWRKKNLLQISVVFWLVFLKLHEVTKFWIWYEWRHNHECTKHLTPGFLWIFFVKFMKKELFIQFYGRFDHFSWTCVVVKLEMIKLCLGGSEVIHASEDKLYANCGLHVNFWKFWLMPFCFIMTKDHFG